MATLILAKGTDGRFWAGDGLWRKQIDPNLFIWPWGPNYSSSKNAQNLVPGTFYWEAGKPGVEMNGPWDDATLDGILGRDVERAITDSTGALIDHTHTQPAETGGIAPA